MMVTETFCPAGPELGVTETIWGRGLMVSEAVLPLANWTPVDVEPATDTLYGVGEETVIEDGI